MLDKKYHFSFIITRIKNTPFLHDHRKNAFRVAKKKTSSEKKKVLSILGVFLHTTFDEVFLFDFYIVILNESSECLALLPIALFLRKKMSKRKSENSDSEDKESKRRKRLEEAKRFIERTILPTKMLPLNIKLIRVC